MLFYNLKQIIRRIIHDKAFSFVNVVGLTVGISSFLVLFLHVSNEKSFDRHFPDHANIYRVISTPEGHDATQWARSLGIVHEAVVTIPEIKEATQFSHTPVGTIKIGEQSFQQKDIMSIDTSFINMFSVESVIGDLSEINKPNTVFISKDFAKKYFKDVNPVGKTIEVEALQYMQNPGTYEIRGVVKNTSPRTHFNYELLLSQKGGLSERFASLSEGKIHWTYNYIKLKKYVDPKVVTSKIRTYYDNSQLKETRGPKDYQFSLEPLTDIHLKSNDRFELKESSSKINIGFLVVISLVILLVSLLNFINLIIAGLIKRTKELGLKKSIGATKSQLVKEILVQVFIFCLVAIGFSFLLIEVLKPFINRFFEIEFHVFYSNPIVFVSILAVFTICLGLALLFVSFYLFRKTSTIDILAGNKDFSGSMVLKSLLVGQVAIVILLLSGTFLVNKQINFIFDQPLGFNKENVVVIHIKDLKKDPAVFAEELKKLSSVSSVGFTRQYFGYPTQSLPLEGLGIDGSAEFVFANYDYLKTMNIRLVESWINPSADTVRGMVINEHLYKRLMERHGSMEALNAYQLTQPLKSDQVRINFIGVAKDFNYNSAHQAIGDFAFWLDESYNRAVYTHVRLIPGNLRAELKEAEHIWDEYYPGQEFDYFFIDDQIASQYKAETILSRILTAFSLLGAMICIVGISAMSLFISQQRTKEIGIRKVNGAKISEVLAMLNKDFVKWVVIAFVIATPIAYYAMNKWLENFAYKTGLSWWIFALAGLLALGIALLTVSWQSWRAATRNPVEALRYE